MKKIYGNGVGTIHEIWFNVPVEYEICVSSFLLKESNIDLRAEGLSFCPKKHKKEERFYLPAKCFNHLFICKEEWIGFCSSNKKDVDFFTKASKHCLKEMIKDGIEKDDVLDINFFMNLLKTYYEENGVDFWDLFKE